MFDLTRTESVAAYFSDHPDIAAVINLAAYTNVPTPRNKKGTNFALLPTQCRWYPEFNYQIRDKGIYLIHISTDMVFRRCRRPRPLCGGPPSRSRDKNRLTRYGYTKALAERIAISTLPSAAILRLIYPVVAKYDLKLTICALLGYHEEPFSYPIFTDQHEHLRRR